MSQGKPIFGNASNSGDFEVKPTSDFEIDKNLGQLVRHLIMKEEITEPVLFRKVHQDWEPCTWSLCDWGAMFKNEKMSMRYGKKNWDKDFPQWESDCGKIDLTWRELLDWMNGQFVFLNKDGSPNDIWVYYDYKYLPDVFHIKSPDEKDFLKLIYFIENLKNKFSWSKLGFPERNGDQTTLWIGSAGSYTPAHFDTYSCNLVCQVYGKKTWLLFPPKDMEYLHPTRIPYEESSVYSGINFASPKGISAHINDLKQCNPLRVTLEQGDCLFIPPKWWHFVMSEDFSISVNTWIELPDDHSIRMEEAVLRSIVAAVVNVTYPETATKLLNPNEMDLTDFNESDLNDLLQQTTTACLQDSKFPKPCSSRDLNKEVNSSLLLKQENQSKKDQVKGNKVLQNPSICNNLFHDGPPQKRSKKSLSISFDELLSRSSVAQKLPKYNFETYINSNSDIQEKFTIENAKEGNVDVNMKVEQIDEENDVEEVIGIKNEQDQGNNGPTYLDHLINAIGHPEVLKCISTQLLKNVALQPPSSDRKK